MRKIKTVVVVVLSMALLLWLSIGNVETIASEDGNSWIVIDKYHRTVKYMEVYEGKYYEVEDTYTDQEDKELLINMFMELNLDRHGYDPNS